MNSYGFCRTTAAGVSFLLCLTLTTSTARAQDNIPHPDREFKGKIGKTVPDSQADPNLFLPRAAPKGAPNILLVLIDDAGFGASSTFGGPCNTSTLDKLASDGLRYNRFHTTAVCSPTRAALLTGHNHHSAGTGIIMECCTGFPGYTGIIPQNTASIGKILQDNGYTTAWIGKNHNTVGAQASMVGPHSRWPNQLGFDYFYGFMSGEMNQWYPTIYENQNPVQAWGTPEEGYNLGIDQTDKSIEWMRYQNSIAPDRPFFLYYAPGATHSPHHPPKEYVEKYKGKFAHGWDKQREITFARQKELGVIPQNTKLTPRPEGLKGWDEWDADARKLFERQMEVYAGYYEFIDDQIGRIVDAIDQTGELDNTLIIYIAGDNGASAEGGMSGTASAVAGLNGVFFPVEETMKFYDKWGQPGTDVHYAVGWSYAMDTPLQWMKQVASHFGGTRNPMVISWPKRIKDKGGLRDQFHHINDLAPTLLDVIGIKQPEFVNGVKQKPMEGVSLAYTFADDGAKAEGRKKTQYFELIGNRGVYHDGWMASAFHKEPWNTAGTKPFDGDKWQLYDLSKDFSQADDVAQQYPDKLKEMQAIFDQEAKKYNVFPLDDRAAGRFANPGGINRPSFVTGRKQFEFYFKYDGGGPAKGGTATLFINGKEAGAGRVEKTIPGKFGFDEMDLGMDLSGAVSEDYKPPFKFSGTIKKVTIDIAEQASFYSLTIAETMNCSCLFRTVTLCFGLLLGLTFAISPASAQDNLTPIWADRAHEVIAEMERQFPRVWTLTQNVDGFHRLAGSRNVIEIHGNMRSLYCMKCRLRKFVDENARAELPPHCPDCRAIMRPDVVLFGELLPDEALSRMRRELATGFGAVFSIGTSAVFPYIQEPVVAARRMGVPTIEINPSETPLSHHADYRLALGAATAMDEIWNRFHNNG